ncbi:hypothetical protein STEG23_023438, partial [Scotinomys teguina]
MTCSSMPFEEEASSVMMKKNRGVPPFNNREQLEAAKSFSITHALELCKGSKAKLISFVQ